MNSFIGSIIEPIIYSTIYSFIDSINNICSQYLKNVINIFVK